mmetsp:Transcript_7702/g.47659  ORF Transcript_7702/g.47659 Transcript_7702/m.47659 type:complete len:96 (+) Transcript_7702:2023-2310(+)
MHAWRIVVRRTHVDRRLSSTSSPSSLCTLGHYYMNVNQEGSGASCAAEEDLLSKGQNEPRRARIFLQFEKMIISSQQPVLTCRCSELHTPEQTRL